ncbi:MAG: hypothetical protein ABJC74_07015 [Gemmatimonadota bacterium]
MISGPTLGREHLRRLRQDAVMVAAPLSVLGIAGPKALECLQGLLTNDLAKPGAGSITYGALLTPKGMLVVDAWVIRLAEQFVWLTPSARKDPTLGIFRKSLPPRLASAEDQSAGRTVLALYGARAIAMLADAGISPAPEPGRVIETVFGGWPLILARPAIAPFAVLMIVGSEVVESLTNHLTRSGISLGDETDVEAARILAGWPALGSEVDEKTLPQEVRYDENEGVSYTKGCYVGQETVARLHFRGHANRELRGLVWQGGPPPASSVIRPDGKPAGEISSVLQLPDRTLGLIKIRREVLEQGVTELDAGGATARLVSLPFATSDLTE